MYLLKRLILQARFRQRLKKLITGNREYIPSEKEEMTLSEKGLPIIFEGGIHYIEDPAYPGEKINVVLYE